ncbi:MAG: cobalamin-dependent protein [Thermodesulfobacteriota bacterium]|nr:cobalamin-dependent protein [Thermodesulfobacteriota bacterium]
MGKKVRILLSKSDQDAHEMGIRYIAQLLRDTGMEVIFTRYHIIDEVADAAEQEDVFAIGLSFYGSGLMYDVSRLMKLLQEKGLDDKIVFLGGTIVEEEKKELLKLGVSEVFLPGVGSPQDIVKFITSRTMVS